MDSGNVGRIAVKKLSVFMEGNNIQQHDCDARDEIGIDAYYELFEKDKFGIMFAAQIKGGKSYFHGDNCFYYDEGNKHIYRWSNFNMPVILVVYDEICDKFYWVDIKNYIVNNPQKNKKGYTFEFPKEGNELNKRSLSSIISRAVINNSESCYAKAKYYYDSFDNLTKLFLNENTKVSNNDTLLESNIRLWLSQKGFDVEDNKFTERIISAILYNIRGIGEIGFLINDEHVRRLSIHEDIIFVTSDTQFKKAYSEKLRYDINKCFNYFSKLKKENLSISIIPFNDIEVMLLDKPVSDKRTIYIHKKGRKVKLFECNSNNRINAKFNETLANILNTYKNILIIGTKYNHVDMIISAMTSLFLETDKVNLIEDRMEINVSKGQVCSFVVNSSDYSSIVDTIYEGIKNKSDRTILNIGNYTICNDVFKRVLEVFDNRKGCIGLLPCKLEYFQDINNELVNILRWFSKLNEKECLRLINNIDYIIKIDGNIKIDGYIYQICKNNKLKWDVVEEYTPEK